MSTKTLVFIFMTIGSLIGGYIPVLFGDSMFSIWSLIWSSAGALIGIWVGFKIGESL